MPVDPGTLEKHRRELDSLFNEHAPIGRAYGMSAYYDDEGCAVFDLPYNPDFDHAMGGIHGGVMATLLDNAGWFTAAPYYENWIATVEMQVRLHEPVQRKHLVARGRLVRAGKRISVANMEVRTTEGTLVASGSGTFTETSAPRHPVQGP
ncbi:MAG: PaaI family thioesterase [Deltaproteobacteria bacterium]|nr:PaaI family thioesterase [Deltaproteobacteria bacterium]